MPRDHKMLQQAVRCLSERKGGVAALKRRLETRRKFILGSVLLTHAAVDMEFRRAMQMALEKALAAKDRGILRELMQAWGWPSKRG